VWDEVREEVELELSLLHRLFAEHSTLIASVQEREPDTTAILALGAILQSFYNGCENIFKRIAQEIDHAVPTGETWHRDLLAAMARPNSQRPSVISESLLSTLAAYLRFRHAFHHIYTYDLRWSSMASLVLACEQTLSQLEKELGRFLESRG